MYSGDIAQCVLSGTVSYDVTRAFVERIKENGGVAYLRSFPYGGHEPQLVGAPIEHPAGYDVFDGSKLDITPAIEEVFIWMRNFDD